MILVASVKIFFFFVKLVRIDWNWSFAGKAENEKFYAVRPIEISERVLRTKNSIIFMSYCVTVARTRRVRAGASHSRSFEF